jgi:PAS domain S-box-containing protein
MKQMVASAKEAESTDASQILIVDDEFQVRSLLEDALSYMGHRTESCSSGRNALEVFSGNSFDLVLLDVNLPDMDGFEIMAAMLDMSPGTSVIMITGDATTQAAIEALKGGAYDYLTKPIRIEDLGRTINNALQHKQLVEERRKSDEALRESEEGFRALVETSLIGICIIQDNQIVYLNPEQEKLYNLLPDQSLNKLINYVHSDDAEKVSEGYRDLLTGTKHSVEEIFRLYPKGKDTEVKWVQCRGSAFQYKGRDAILVNTVDITRSKELENILRLKSKMISLGRVAAGIAHEIRNPLTGINSYLYTLDALLEGDDSDSDETVMMKQIIEQMQVASNKIESVIKRVLDFSKPGLPSMALINLNQTLEDAVKMSAVSLRKKGIKIETALDDKLPECYGDNQLIEQVILNLIDNAVKAMKKVDGEKRIEISSHARHDSVCLLVSDTGTGIPLAIREKIFDPFFTTDSDGSGIGLAISQRIINDHSGSIHLRDNKWGGAEIEVELPIDKRKSGR